MKHAREQDGRDLTDSDDEDIVKAVFEATAMAGGLSDEDDEAGEPRH